MICLHLKWYQYSEVRCAQNTLPEQVELLNQLLAIQPAYNEETTIYNERQNSMLSRINDLIYCHLQ